MRSENKSRVQIELKRKGVIRVTIVIKCNLSMFEVRNWIMKCLRSEYRNELTNVMQVKL